MLKNLAMTMGLVAAMATTGAAAGVYGTDVTGSDLQSSRGGSPEIVGSGGYEATTVEWDISQTAPGVWHYDYTFTVAVHNISHLLLELSPDSITDPHVVYNVSPDGTTTFGTFGSQGGSNPGIPASIYGMKFQSTVGTQSLNLVFDSDRAPVWGNFYTKGGQSYAYNGGLIPANHDSTDKTLFIARPDGQVAVPEPGSVVLLGCGALGLAGWGLRRKTPTVA